MEENTEYGASIAVAKLVSFIGWIAVIAGVGLTGYILKEGGMALMGLASTISVSLTGLILVIAGQASRAVMDNANYSKLMLEVMIKGETQKKESDEISSSIEKQLQECLKDNNLVLNKRLSDTKAKANINGDTYDTYLEYQNNKWVIVDHVLYA